jgi:predicted transglutaminase-like cysteine proteinase
MGLAIISSGVFVVSANASGLPTSTPRDELEAQRLHGWQSLITQSMQISDAEKLQAVNAFFNRHIRYDEDLAVWGQVDYWASPLETLGLGAGDCEDFAVAKYFTLRLLGVSEQHLRLVYSTLSSTQQPHMVLGYWSDDQEAPVLLDNLRSQASPATQRPDLQVSSPSILAVCIDSTRAAWSRSGMRNCSRPGKP